MKDFDSLRHLWNEDPAENITKGKEAIGISKTSQNSRMKMERSQLYGSIVLALTAVFISGMAIFGNFGFRHWYTYAAMAILSLVCLGQAMVMYYTYLKLKKIDESVSPALHLQQWEAYYRYRENLIRYNLPLYFILLNLAMGVYLYEVFLGRPWVYVSIFIALYTAWMLFAIFYLGKKSKRKEEKRLQAIMYELKRSAEALKNQENI